MEQFCEIFSSIQILECDVEQPNDLLILISRLPRLSRINTHRFLSDEHCLSWLKEEAEKLKITLHIEHDICSSKPLCIWVDRCI
jgi:hypothetical protein